MSITHTTPSTAPDGTIPGYIQPSHWNATHTVDLANEYTSAVHVDLRKTCTLDGVVNDTGAFSAAIAAAVALAPVVWVYVAPGKTALTDLFTNSTTGQTIRFYGGGTIKLRTAGGALLQCNGATSRIICDDIKLDGSNLALTNNSRGLLYCTAGEMIVTRCEIFNVGTAASGTSGGIASNTGGRLRAAWNELHDIRGMAIHVQGTGKADVSHNWVHDCGHNAIFVGPINNGTVAVVSDGFTVAHNIINNITSDLGGTGQYGNGINVYRVSNGSIVGNQIKDVAWSFIRLNDATNIAVTGNRGTGAGETGAWSEFACDNNAWTGNVFMDMNNHGLVCTNAGGSAVIFIGNIIRNFGIALVSSTFGAGMVMEYAIAKGNYIDGNNQPGATYGIKVGSGAGTTNSWQNQVVNNQTMGCKYDVGVAVSANGGTQRMVISGNMNIRQDANYSSPIGASGGSNADSGNGSAIGAAMAARVYWGSNLWNVPTGQQPPTGEIGSRMKIGGFWHISDGTAAGWRPEIITATADTITYSASMTPATFTTMSRISTITATNTTAFTINAVPGTLVVGALQSFVIKRSSASALGTLTWNAIYKVGTWTQPATNNTSRTVTFQWNGTNWVEIYRTPVDVPT